MQTIVDVQHVSLVIQHRAILQDINFTIKRGEIVTVIGPNGAGKTALLKVILGLYKPTLGKVISVPNLRIGYMPQVLVVESLMPLDVQRFLLLSPRANVAKCIELAKLLNFTHIMQSPIQTVSGGELQRVLLARALLNDPDLLVLDEPAHGIDINGQAALYKLILQMRSKLNCAILMVSHDLHLVIAGTDQVICLNKHICCSGSPAAVTQNPEFIHLFGTKIASELALYTHHHDHTHDS
ncbi:MAG TPA: ATP-binding cassette domain-containing protein [Gammaproteobacteria bacterium]|nr:ATP-binding cassette domain-containing protein [Gammaproteobacteria bacterium]